MNYKVKLSPENVEEVNIDELQELKEDIDKKLSELKAKENILGIKSVYSPEHASVKLSFNN